MKIDIKDFKLNRQEVQALNILDYFKRDCDNPKEVWLLLHGYGEKAQTIVKRLRTIIPDDVIVIAPNGTYPIPQKVQETYKLGFAWYFYDNTIDKYYIDYSVSCSAIKALLEKLCLNKLPLRVIGYSQGGYLAPFVATALKNTIQVIGLNCSIRADYLPKDIKFTIDQIHSSDDEFVDLKTAKKRFLQLVEKGNKGSFTVLENEKHFLSTTFLGPIAKLCSKQFNQ